MCARLLACPLCSQPGFLTLDALRAGLVSVATRPLACPVCNEILLGIDKLTIHLFSHTINQTNNEPPKIIDVSPTIDVCTMVRNMQNVPLQTWNVLGKSKTNVREEEKQDYQSKPPNQLIFLPKDSAIKENNQVEASQGYLDKTANQQVIFLQNKETIREERETERNQDFASKSVIFLQGSDPLRIEDPEKLIFVQGKDTLRKEGEEVGPEANHVIFLSNKEQDKGQNLNQMIFIQGKEKSALESEKNQEYLAKSAPNQMIFLQNSNQLFAQNLDFQRDGDTELQKVDSSGDVGNSSKIWENNQPVQFPVMMNFKDCQKNCDTSTEKAILDKDQREQLKEFSGGPPKDKTERCDICGFYFPDKNILTLHKQVVHMLDKDDVNVASEHLFKNYPCFLCTKVFKMRGSLMIHMRVAHTGCNSNSPNDADPNANENGYNCPTCGKNFRKEQHVTQHLKTHEGKQWECDVCSKMFTTKYFLKKHKRLHSGEMPYKCNICDKTFTFQQSYHKHRLYHKDDKPHTCITCGRSFKELSTLHNHERIHTGEKPFACETCGKCFRQRVSYLVHRRIHTGDKPYKCTACGNSFRYKVSQRNHKCPIQQQTASSQRPESLVQKLLETTTNHSSPPGLSESEMASNLGLNVEDNKYVLIVDEQGQHVLTRQSEVEANRNGEVTQNNDSEQMALYDKKQSLDEARDFFSMVMSPLSSPSTEMEHLRLSSPENQNNIPEISSDIMAQENYSSTTSLQTINEESLKELLYGIGSK